MNLTYYPFPPFKINTGQVNILDIGNSQMYADICQGFRDRTDDLRVSNDNLELQTMSSQCSWYGDLMLSVDLNRLFMKKIQTQIIKLMADEQQVAVLDQSRAMIAKVMEASFLLDLPLDVEEAPGLDQALKFAGIHFPTDLTHNPSAVLEALVQTHVELGLKQCPVMTNVSHYLNPEQWAVFEQQVADLDITVIIIEYSETNRMEKFKNCCYYYVDEDLADWRDMN
ncbi:type II-A CRISPR-associated protein Csn2 [Lactiplantibacillus pentosus]|uniref:type II-A CRISPR-associated protein Csn2 n=1 Tax=Lactiplantibacillus pentosus TaxID=1589 RepID=UPI000C7C5D15|nr:type II-A CRISPR-associated protein Csn2 [Lactiplantibacillus pentosus]AUI77283.1 type II-A CRISPR-associated protein Csn2 [Lactiplantibacillus pentosus]MCA1342643.1 type II-A CRISPR-associated protein Csn2 [Lactiplantibacillus pentosus]MCE6031666.1 type II-A CRISPR-associated protein Csn2 [Lactiplantibacillus pentosus]MCJ8183040.1 type II-A CRISPR-associated protein Csn2 [Lactiplantibacillus pentosus]MCT3063590.1 type II-A CRISPR-associated protein Csn2 [Lactiplantibacillus pentosus]